MILKTKTYEIFDLEALKGDYPQLMKYTPDHAKIKKALSIGIMPSGVSLINTPLGEAIKQTAKTERL